jgi:hypothetical protein
LPEGFDDCGPNVANAVDEIRMFGRGRSILSWPVVLGGIGDRPAQEVAAFRLGHEHCGTSGFATFRSVLLNIQKPDARSIGFEALQDEVETRLAGEL